MTRTTKEQPAESSRTEITRFNALRHGVLSRYTVLPWEDADEYQAIVVALVAEHTPQGPPEEYLVEEIAGIMWRKRRLRLAEAAANRRGLEGTLAQRDGQGCPCSSRYHRPIRTRGRRHPRYRGRYQGGPGRYGGGMRL